MACICSWMSVYMYVLACMFCLIWGCDTLVLRRQEALVAPSRARSCLTIEECCRGHRASAFLRDAPHATRTHMKCYKHLQHHQKKTTYNQNTPSGALAFHRKLACVDRMQTQRQHLSHAGLLEAAGLSEGPGVLRLSFVKEPRGPRRG